MKEELKDTKPTVWNTIWNIFSGGLFKDVHDISINMTENLRVHQTQDTQKAQ